MIWIVDYAQEQNISTTRCKLNIALAQGELPELKEPLKARLDWGVWKPGFCSQPSYCTSGEAHLVFISGIQSPPV